LLQKSSAFRGTNDEMAFLIGLSLAELPTT
jgi:hypothetical protein